jgi:hypothetical protein
MLASLSPVTDYIPRVRETVFDTEKQKTPKIHWITRISLLRVYEFPENRTWGVPEDYLRNAEFDVEWSAKISMDGTFADTALENVKLKDVSLRKATPHSLWENKIPPSIYRSSFAPKGDVNKGELGIPREGGDSGKRAGKASL